MSHLIPQRSPEMMSTEFADLCALLDDTAIAHVSVIRDGRPFTFGTLIARVDDGIVIHGSTGSRWMRQLTAEPCAVAVTKVDGVVVARSAFESSMLYRSALILGQFAEVPEARKEEVLRLLTDRLIPGRTAEVRPSTKKELAATMLLEMPMNEWSLRISDDWPEDPDDDVAGDAWAGKIRFTELRSRLEATPDLRAGISPTPAILAAQKAAGRLSS
ncbi:MULTISPECIES: pyridoxamine 5'-phosphate oxidase family protein [Brevibacterium]|uniref:pyridoxamine 5'-phosphate oxidase family protein n=1 Tax=Brevibacterium TaxID=1696 RepID=UPI001BAE13E9|nr:pyridoxamine 5'-phosphate oxidase family protein [Brevibacterium sp. W7.2]